MRLTPAAPIPSFLGPLEACYLLVLHHAPVPQHVIFVAQLRATFPSMRSFAYCSCKNANCFVRQKCDGFVASLHVLFVCVFV